MKLVVQRVKKASVITVSNGLTVGKIEKGLLVLLGFKKGDKEKDCDFLVSKLSKLRVMADSNDKMNLSVLDTKSEILIVSQFTLYANTEGGNRPSFIETEEPGKAKELYEYFVKKLTDAGVQISTGSFGEYMEIESVLDGPVTIIFET